MALLKTLPASLQTDDELISLFRQQHNQEVLATLLLRYSDLVYGTCLKYLEDHEGAKDAVMDIYQELLEKLNHHDIANFKGWLYVLTKNHCLMKLRKKKKLVVTSLDASFMQSEDFSHLEHVIEKETLLNLMSTCMDGLQDEQQKTVRLFYLENKCYNEIATITGLEWNKVRSLIQNGRRNLKICMEKNG